MTHLIDVFTVGFTGFILLNRIFLSESIGYLENYKCSRERSHNFLRYLKYILKLSLFVTIFQCGALLNLFRRNPYYLTFLRSLKPNFKTVLRLWLVFKSNRLSARSAQTLKNIELLNLYIVFLVTVN